MASCHSNFGVFETEDPMDGLLLHTVANLKHPPRIPTETEPERTSADILAHTKVRGLSVPSSEGMIKE